jgi:hypothetical protein
MTAGELVAALQMAREIGETQPRVSAEVKPQREGVAEPAPAPDENVTAMPAARHIK